MRLCLLLGLMLLFAWASAQAKVYRWVDENGVSHFSDTPPPGMAAEEPVSTQGAKATGKSDFSAPQINFELSGVVQDTAGRPLQDVDVTIIEHHYQPPGHYEFKEVHREERVGGHFHISCQNCPIHKLRFRKTGYFSREVQLKFTEEEEKQAFDALTRIMMSDPPKVPATPQTIIRENMVVTLEPEGDAVRLSRIDQQLIVSSRGDVMVLKDLVHRLKGLGNYQFARVLESELASGAPAPEIRLRAGYGAFAAARRALAKGTYGRSGFGVYLDFSKADGGIVEATPSGTNFSKNLHAMQKAPLGGYRDRLELRPSSHGKPIYFYFKMGKFYGKGIAAPLQYEKSHLDQECFVSHLELYLNPDGTPNLRGK